MEKVKPGRIIAKSDEFKKKKNAKKRMIKIKYKIKKQKYVSIITVMNQIMMIKSKKAKKPQKNNYRHGCMNRQH